MKLKICGMKVPKNILEVKELRPDYVGFIFYKKSPRCITNDIKPIAKSNKETIQSVGVFVNSPINKVVSTIKAHDLDFAQLHGNEDIAYIKELYKYNVNIIKAFSINEHFEWDSISTYSDYSTYFLFDTATKKYGGSGQKFSWKLLHNYKGNTPFFLSGGISIDDIKTINKISHPMLYGVDINSQFEIEPGMKNVPLLKKMIKQLRND